MFEFNATEFVDRLDTLTARKNISDIISSSNISTMKSRNSCPSAITVYELSQRLGVSMEYLLTGQDSNPYKAKFDKVMALVDQIKEIQ